MRQSHYRGVLGDRVVLWFGRMEANRFSRLIRVERVMSNRIRIGLCFVLLVCDGMPSRSFAQCCGPEYRIVCKTVCEERQVTCYRNECETVYDAQEVSRQVPVYETEMRERRFKVLKPASS